MVSRCLRNSHTSRKGREGIYNIIGYLEIFTFFIQNKVNRKEERTRLLLLPLWFNYTPLHSLPSPPPSPAIHSHFQVILYLNHNDWTRNQLFRYVYNEFHLKHCLLWYWLPYNIKARTTSFLAFAQEQRSLIKQQQPDITFEELHTLLSTRWKELSDTEKKVCLFEIHEYLKSHSLQQLYKGNSSPIPSPDTQRKTCKY